MDFELDFEDGYAIIDYNYEHEFGKAGLHLKVDVIEILKKAAEKSDNTVDDKLVAAVELALG